MNPAKVVRDRIRTLTDLPNVGPAVAADLRRLGIDSPEQLKGRDAFALYDQLCSITGRRQDPCVIDVFLSITRFMDGDEARPWWAYTAERKAAMQQRLEH
jgi:hypothetical protein